MTTRRNRTIIIDDMQDRSSEPGHKAAVEHWYKKTMTTRRPFIPVHREIAGKPGRKVTLPTDPPDTLVYYCLDCNREYKKRPVMSACPYCYRPLLARVKGE